MSVPNIYTMVVFDLHPKVKDFIDSLNTEGQIDLDSSGYPYVIGVDSQGSNITVTMVRGGQQESFVLNTRKRREPILSWNKDDGFIRSGGKKTITFDNVKDRSERKKRPMESFDKLLEQILKG